ncbi:solute carrier family 28 member 3-like [Myripristis murdjan]|uniref:solute carrier family 28 member 3-like n=1 Tax=Myripristis murdjan TaxID=586833 RepID=UPI0011760F56|nr:solute carrier family 28 member 3 [Myripristis murdjan]
MELNALQEESQKKGSDNKAFESEEQDQICIDVDSASEDQNACEKYKVEDKENEGFLEKKMEAFQEYLGEHKVQIKLIVLLVLGAGFIAMVIAACILNFYQAIGLLVITLVTAFFLLWDWMMERYGDRVWEELSPVRDLFNRNWFWIRWVVCVLLLVGVVCWLALDTAKQGTRQLVSFAGLLVFIFLMVVFSKSPFRISWQTLLWGTGLQFVFGLLILRTKYGYIAVEWLGKQAEIFLSYADVGSEFVFGESYADHMFAFKVMPVLVFFSTVISILYYVGFMPWLILKIGFIMQVTMGTSPTESMAAAGNIFLGQTESPLLIRPYISQLTRSEIHAVMTGGFASIAGSVMGAFIAFGIESSHLLSASIMSAPASLAISKTFWPETETPCVTVTSSIKLDKGDSKNMLEAASNGASSAAGLVANVITNIIAFLALLAFLDAALSWLGAMFDYPQLSFSVICSYLFMPLAFMMGVSWEDSFIVGELIGLKTVFNEFVAYQKLSELINKRKAGGPEYVDNVKQYISVHSETIATYALCGFANFASLGMMVGALSGMAPERSTDISNCGIRALIAGSVSSFMTACIAGVLYIPTLPCPQFLDTLLNNTEVAASTQLVTCCTDLYNSVTVYEPWNVTVGGGFSLSSLQVCCPLTPPTNLNCSLVL